MVTAPALRLGRVWKSGCHPKIAAHLNMTGLFSFAQVGARRLRRPVSSERNSGSTSGRRWKAGGPESSTLRARLSG
jgi:hypothetical protein